MPSLVRQAPGFAALVAVAVALGACAAEPQPIERVRVLRLNPGALMAFPARGSRTAAVRSTTLTAARGPQLPPAMAVPQIGSVAAGAPSNGRLIKGLQLPGTGPDWVTYDPILHRVPNRDYRRWGTDRLLAFLLYVLRDYRLANAGVPQVVIGDLSLPHGGPFGSDFGGLGHRSHQNGLDVDVYYPRLDRALAPPDSVAQVDRALAQDLVNRFVGAGAQYAFVGLRVGLGGPAGIVQAIRYHDDHLHVRIANWRR
ncbi:MAG TPA: penicillin-insensitive murein endopeptidase [Solirubrobacteraceae bacterium]|nr:penicillin-insensitive murein endopeptidase [Solirubrobacteraceae bacterium]